MLEEAQLHSRFFGDSTELTDGNTLDGTRMKISDAASQVPLNLVDSDETREDNMSKCRERILTRLTLSSGTARTRRPSTSSRDEGSESHPSLRR